VPEIGAGVREQRAQATGHRVQRRQQAGPLPAVQHVEHLGAQPGERAEQRQRRPGQVVGRELANVGAELVENVVVDAATGAADESG
jgi:hypothetical protein